MRKEQKILCMTDRIMRYSNGEIPYFTAKAKAKEYYDGKPLFVFGEWISGDKNLHASFEIAEKIIRGWADNPPEDRSTDCFDAYNEGIAEKVWRWLLRHSDTLLKISYTNDVVEELAVNYDMTYKEAIQVVRKSPLKKCLRLFPDVVLHLPVGSVAGDIVNGSKVMDNDYIDSYLHTICGELFLREKMSWRSAYDLSRRFGLRDRLNNGEIKAWETPVADVVNAMLEWDKSVT